MILAPASGECRYSARTHVGLVRQVNEDSILALPELGIWVVSDGMGGHDGGDYASQTIISAIAALPPHLEPAEKMIETREAIQNAHRMITAESHARGGVTIGATVVVLILVGEHFVCLWAGDSRLYRLRGGMVEMVSFDHSLVGELVAEGKLTWDEAEAHPQSNAITRAVGVGDELEIDKRRGDVLPGDRFLLCSDGLTKYADEMVIGHLLATCPIETVCDALLAVALDGGGADNISAIVVEAS